MLAGGADLNFTDKFAALVRVHRQLVAEIGFAVPLRPACVQIPLTPLRWRPVGRHRVIFNDGSVDHPAATGDVAMPGQLPVDCFEKRFRWRRFDQAHFEISNRDAVGNQAGISRPAKRWKLNRSSNWNSLCSSGRLNSCRISRIRTITSVGNGGLPPRSRSGRGAALSTEAAIAAKSTCRSSTWPQTAWASSWQSRRELTHQHHAISAKPFRGSNRVRK